MYEFYYLLKTGYMKLYCYHKKISNFLKTSVSSAVYWHFSFWFTIFYFFCPKSATCTSLFSSFFALNMYICSFVKMCHVPSLQGMRFSPNWPTGEGKLNAGSLFVDARRKQNLVLLSTSVKGFGANLLIRKFMRINFYFS